MVFMEQIQKNKFLVNYSVWNLDFFILNDVFVFFQCDIDEIYICCFIFNGLVFVFGLVEVEIIICIY